LIRGKNWYRSWAWTFDGWARRDGAEVFDRREGGEVIVRWIKTSRIQLEIGFLRRKFEAFLHPFQIGWLETVERYRVCLSILEQHEMFVVAFYYGVGAIVWALKWSFDSIVSHIDVRCREERLGNEIWSVWQN
jgi:hypothetical protein